MFNFDNPNQKRIQEYTTQFFNWIKQEQPNLPSDTAMQIAANMAISTSILDVETALKHYGVRIFSDEDNNLKVDINSIEGGSQYPISVHIVENEDKDRNSNE